MPKNPKSEAYWKEIVKSYAKRDYKLSTGKSPCNDRWKPRKKSIEACPKHNKGQRVDLFGRPIMCEFSYHEVC